MCCDLLYAHSGAYPTELSFSHRIHGNKLRQCRIIERRLTVAETDGFIRYASSIWSDDERADFVTWIANNPLAGNVIRGSGGLRKVRYSRRGMGKRGGARVVHYNVLDDGEI